MHKRVKVLTFFCVGAGNTIIGVDNGKFQFRGITFWKFCKDTEYRWNTGISC